MKIRAASLALGAGLAAAGARADVLVSNFAAAAGPPGTFFGSGSSTLFKAAGFTPQQDYTLDSVRLSMSFAGGGVGVVSIWVGAGAPEFRIQNLSSPPQIGAGDFLFTPASALTLDSGQTYWVVVESVSNPSGSFIWEGTAPSTMPSGAAAFAGYIFNNSPSTTPNRIEVRATPAAGPCYPNCDGSTVAPVLTGNDFQCFLSSYVEGRSYANCDNSTQEPLLTANDFVCFLNAYIAGCS